MQTPALESFTCLIKGKLHILEVKTVGEETFHNGI